LHDREPPRSNLSIQYLFIGPTLTGLLEPFMNTKQHSEGKSSGTSHSQGLIIETVRFQEPTKHTRNHIRNRFILQFRAPNFLPKVHSWAILYVTGVAVNTDLVI